MSQISRRGFGALLTATTLSLALPALAQDLSGVTLRIGDQVGEQRARLEAAGLLDDIPYAIDWSVYPAAVNLHEALKAEAIDIGMSADSPAISAMAGGARTRIVGAFSNGGFGTSIIVPKDSPIQSIEDLRGKTISPTTRGSVSHYLTLGALKQAGIDEDEVTLAFLTPVDASAAFQSGGLDAWAIWGIYKARSMGVLGARELFDGQGVNTGTIVWAATEKALEDPAKIAAIEDYLARIEQGYEWARANREDFLTFYEGFTKQDRATVEPMYAEQTDYRRQPLDDDFVAGLQKVFDTWVEAGVLGGSLDLSAHVARDLPALALN